MKISLNTILQVIGLILIILGFSTAAGIAPLVIGLILLIGGLDVFGILRIGKVEEKGTRILNGLIWGLALILAVNASGILGLPVQELKVPTNQQDQQAALQGTSATLKLNVKNAVGGTYASTGTIYALHNEVSDRNDFMKLIQEGKIGEIAPYTMSLTTGVYSLAGYTGKVGDIVTFAGYQDNTPGAAENVSFVMTAKLTGLENSDSGNAWTISNPVKVWYNYPTLLYYNYADTAVTSYLESEASSVEKSVTFDMFPTNNGEQWTDSVLWLEAPQSNIGAIKTITITPETGTAVTYSGIPQEVVSSENLFRAVPALTTSTDKMYKVGAFPAEGLLRTSTTAKGRMSVKVTYDHPASGSVLFYFKTTQNSNALTSAGGHYDSPATNFMLNMSVVGTDAWT
ncbi:MAG: hypothetical protein PHP06_05995 [Clostridia bacterium]|nr:hypothetical protein [Clostridia bacterium]